MYYAFNPFPSYWVEQITQSAQLSMVNAPRSWIAYNATKNGEPMRNFSGLTYEHAGIDTTYSYTLWKYSYYHDLSITYGAGAYWSIDESSGQLTSETYNLTGDYIAYWTNTDNGVRVDTWGTQEYDLVFYDTTNNTYPVLQYADNETEIPSNYHLEGVYKMWYDDTPARNIVSNINGSWEQTVSDLNTSWDETMQEAVSSTYEDAFNQGKIEGAESNRATINAFDMFGQAFTATTTFLGTEVLPNLTVGTIIIVPTIVTLLVVIIRILKK